MGGGEKERERITKQLTLLELRTNLN